MIDTGASDIVLGMQEAKKIGINPKNLIFNKRYQTANGEVFGASIRLNEIEVGGVKFYDMPASIRYLQNGEIEESKWVVGGRLHRLGLPAEIRNDGMKSWWVHGCKHNSTGPAVVYWDGREEYWNEGTRVIKQ